MDAAIPRAVAVVGPTAAGKSALGVELARGLSSRVLCCDSVQVYRGLDVGSAKPTRSQRERVEHGLLDLVDPDVAFSAGDYARAAWAELERAPGVFVGGTGFYLRAVSITHSGGEESLGAEGEARRESFDAMWLERERAEPGVVHRALAAVDAETARAIHPRNSLRALRALWLCEWHGEAISAVRRRDPPRARLSLLLVVVDPGVEAVDRAIDERCDQMITMGWLREVEMLRGRGYDARHRSMRSLGYKQLLEHLEGQISLEEAVSDIKLMTRRYARRQRTYFRHQLSEARRIEVDRVDPATIEDVRARALRFLSGDEPCPTRF